MEILYWSTGSLGKLNKVLLKNMTCYNFKIGWIWCPYCLIILLGCSLLHGNPEEQRCPAPADCLSGPQVSQSECSWLCTMYWCQSHRVSQEGDMCRQLPLCINTLDLILDTNACRLFVLAWQFSLLPYFTGIFWWHIWGSHWSCRRLALLENKDRDKRDTFECLYMRCIAVVLLGDLSCTWGLSCA